VSGERLPRGCEQDTELVTVFEDETRENADGKADQNDGHKDHDNGVSEHGQAVKGHLVDRGAAGSCGVGGDSSR
jgi:hypothetical protein